MKAWSDNPIHDRFRIKFFADTNLLVYLVDNTYKSLIDFVELVNNCPFSEIVSSRYVIFEFAGVRKNEQYFRIAAANSEKTAEGKINFSSLIKYKDGFKNPDAVFEDVVDEIKDAVNAEVEQIARDFNIDFEYSSMHAGQLEPTLEVCLASKISNQDSLVLVSAALPQESMSTRVIFLTNDSAFVSAFETGGVSGIMEDKGIVAPKLMHVTNMPSNINLIGNDSTAIENWDSRVVELIRNELNIEANDLYLGRTFPPNGDDFPADCVSFTMKLGKTLNQGWYVTILGKDLDFIYTTKKTVEFWNNGNPIEDGFSPKAGNRCIAFKVVEKNENGDDITPQQEILDSLRGEGNIVFIHPDSN